MTPNSNYENNFGTNNKNDGYCVVSFKSII